MQHLALFDQLLHDAGHVLDRHGRGDPVLVVQVDMVGAQALERLLDHLADMLRAAVQCNGAVDGKTELGGDLHLVAEGLQCFADEFFAGIRSVHFGGIEERHAVLDRRADRSDRLLFWHRRIVVAGKIHAAGADFRHLHGPQCALFHGISSCGWKVLPGSGVCRLHASQRPECSGGAKQHGGPEKFTPAVIVE